MDKSTDANLKLEVEKEAETNMRSSTAENEEKDEQVSTKL